MTGLIRLRKPSFGQKASFSTVARVLAMAASVVAVLLWLGVSLSLIMFPYPVDQAEAARFAQCVEVARGGDLYVPPRGEFVSCLYTPLYFKLAGMVMVAAGSGAGVARSISFASAVGAVYLIGRTTWDYTKMATSTAFAVACFVSIGPLIGQQLSQVAPDAMMLLFLALWMRTAQRSRSLRAAALAAGFLVLAVLSKQNALFAVVPAVFFHMTDGRWQAMLFGAAVSVGLAACVVTLQVTSGGGFLDYTLFAIRHHGWQEQALTGFWFDDLFPRFAIPVLLGVLGLIAPLESGLFERRDRLLLLTVLVSAVGVCWPARAHDGGFENCDIPMFAAISVCAGIGLSRWSKGWYPPAASVGMGWLVATMFLASAAVSPRLMIPTARDRQQMDEVVKFLRSEPGEVYAPYFGGAGVYSGKRSWAPEACLADIMGRQARGHWRFFPPDLQKLIRERALAAILLPDEPTHLDSLLEGYYEPDGVLPVGRIIHHSIYDFVYRSCRVIYRPVNRLDEDDEYDSATGTPLTDVPRI